MTDQNLENSFQVHSPLAPKTVTFTKSIKESFSKFATFKGRASRTEYWYLVLFYFLLYGVAVLMAVIDSTGIGTSIVLLTWLVFLIPGISALVRRLHDTNRSGWWYWIAAIPFGGIAVIFFLSQPGTPGDNDFGPAH